MLYFANVLLFIFYGRLILRPWLTKVLHVVDILVLPGWRARIVRCGGRYDPQLVKRSSE